MVKYGLADPVWQPVPQLDLAVAARLPRHPLRGADHDGQPPDRLGLADHLDRRRPDHRRVVHSRPAARLHRRHQAQHLGRLAHHRRGLDDRRRAAELRHRVPVHRGLRHQARVAPSGGLGLVQGRDHARDRLLPLPDGPDGALHAGQHARGHLRRLRPHGPGAGPIRAAPPAQVHPAHLADPPDHDHGAVDPQHPHRFDLHRGDLRPARARQLLHHRQPAPGLPPDHGAGADRGCLVGRLLHPQSDIAYALVDPRVRSRACRDDRRPVPAGPTRQAEPAAASGTPPGTATAATAWPWSPAA